MMAMWTLEHITSSDHPGITTEVHVGPVWAEITFGYPLVAISH